jgi:pimeloyl-ACP methyl ester carboxylesterase
MRVLRKILKWAGLVLLVLVVAGAIYQQIGLLLDDRLAPPSNDMIAVDGRAVHLVCEGAGPRTFVLDAGAGAGVFEWYRVQPLLAKAGRVCAFDRPGLGWSASVTGGYDGIVAGDHLAALVKAAHIATPFIYVGHSLGANFGEIYQARYPHAVAALVLIEPGMPPDLLEDFHGTRSEAMEASDCDYTCYAAGLATAVGVTRLASLALGHKALDERTRSIYQAYLTRPATLMTTLASLGAATKTAYECMDVREFGKTPVLTFASTQTREPESNETIEDVKRWQVHQRAYLADLAAKSTRGGGLVIVPHSTHSSMVLGKEQAAFVVRAILAFVKHAGL